MSSLREALEAALAESFDDLAAHMAYADHLQEQGDPRGELIQVQLALEDPGLPPEERAGLRQREGQILAAHQDHWLGKLAPFLDPDRVPTWRRGQGGQPMFRLVRGWITALEIDEMGAGLGEAMKGHPLLGLLQGLAIRYQPYDEDAGWDALAGCGCLGRLRRFQLGPEDDQCHTDGERAVELVRLMPRLEELELYAHRVDLRALFALPLPHLRKLTAHHLHEYPLEVLAENATLTRLTHLDFWPHALEPGDEAAYITLEALRALVHSPHLRSLTHLTVLNSDLGDDGCAEVVRSGILKRLEVLNIRGGRVSDRGARLLAACPDFRHLEQLTITSNQLTAEGVAALEATGVRIEAGGQLDPAAIERLEYLYEGDME